MVLACSFQLPVLAFAPQCARLFAQTDTVAFIWYSAISTPKSQQHQHQHQQKQHQQLQHQQQLVIKFRARLCRSVMLIEEEERFMAFECDQGAGSFKDFTVWNKSEIPLHFTLVRETSDPDHELEFTQLERAEPVSSVVVPAFSDVKIKVAFGAVALGQKEHMVRLCNAQDPQNQTELAIHTTVNRPGPAVLRLVPGTVDFGACCRGQQYTSRVSLKSLTDEMLELDLHSLVPPGMSFYLQDRYRYQSLIDEPSLSSSSLKVAPLDESVSREVRDFALRCPPPPTLLAFPLPSHDHTHAHAHNESRLVVCVVNTVFAALSMATEGEPLHGDITPSGQAANGGDPLCAAGVAGCVQ